MLNYKIICKTTGIDRDSFILVLPRFDVCLLIKSFNRLNAEEKQKILKNLLLTLKVDGQVFLYETEWSNDKGQRPQRVVRIPRKECPH